ncbi:MAG: hypothetical protein AMXMBFR61_15560 [Fimbriimonadales bacterium]
MKTGPIITVLLVAAGIAVAVYSFMQSSSPYVTISEAKSAAGRKVHVAAELVPESIVNDLDRKELRFVVKDAATGERLPVVYHGFKPENMESAPRVVVQGAVENGEMRCDKILLKCPSKYEGKVETSGT